MNQILSNSDDFAVKSGNCEFRGTHANIHWNVHTQEGIPSARLGETLKKNGLKLNNKNETASENSSDSDFLDLHWIAFDGIRDFTYLQKLWPSFLPLEKNMPDNLGDYLMILGKSCPNRTDLKHILLNYSYPGSMLRKSMNTMSKDSSAKEDPIANKRSEGITIVPGESASGKSTDINEEDLARLSEEEQEAASIAKQDSLNEQQYFYFSLLVKIL